MQTLPEMLNIACAAYGEPPGGGMARQHIIRKVVGEILELNHSDKMALLTQVVEEALTQREAAAKE